MTFDDLQQFCSTDNLRPSIMKPFYQAGFAMATDGHLLIRLPGFEQDDTMDAPRAMGLFESALAANGEPHPLPVLPDPAEKCERCSGTGRHRCGCGDEHAHAECKGLGLIDGMGTMQIGTRFFFVSLIRRIASLPNVMIGMDGEPLSAAYFTFDGGDGLIMPMRKN